MERLLFKAEPSALSSIDSAMHRRSKTMDDIFLFQSDHILVTNFEHSFQCTNLKSLQTSAQPRSPATGYIQSRVFKSSFQDKAPSAQTNERLAPLFYCMIGPFRLHDGDLIARIHFKAQKSRLVHNRRLYLQFNQPRSQCLEASINKPTGSYINQKVSSLGWRWTFLQGSSFTAIDQ